MTPRQEQAALAIAGGQSTRQAAKRCGAGVRTVARWRGEAEFRDRVQQLRDSMFSVAVGRLTRLSGKAASTLARLLASHSEKVQLQACKAVLEGAMKSRELHDLAAQVEDLRRRLQEIQRDNSPRAYRATSRPGTNGAAGRG